jgi:hypothetical protein
MLKRAVHLICAAAWVVAGTSAITQEGHPLTGTWSGDWGPAADARTRITLVMNWDGKAVTGTINPGPDAVALGRVTVDYAKWTVRIEAEGKDAAGKPAKIVADGKLDDLGSWHRTLSGSWSQGGAKGTFKLRRD